MNDIEREELTRITAELRHLYENLKRQEPPPEPVESMGVSFTFPGLADGILGRQIQRLERLTLEPTPPTTEELYREHLEAQSRWKRAWERDLRTDFAREVSEVRGRVASGLESLSRLVRGR